jgi:hypothetical protein
MTKSKKIVLAIYISLILLINLYMGAPIYYGVIRPILPQHVRVYFADGEHGSDEYVQYVKNFETQEVPGNPDNKVAVWVWVTNSFIHGATTSLASLNFLITVLYLVTILIINRFERKLVTQ